VRVTVSLGEGSAVPDPESCSSPNLLIVTAGYIPYSEEIYRRGFSLASSPICRNSQSPLPAMKTTNYLENLLAREQAKNAGADDALFLNEKGYIAEASSSNIFLLSKNVLKTPSETSGILPGITRDIVLGLAPQAGIEAVEADILPAEIAGAEEAFITNSVMEIMPVNRLDRKEIGSGSPGPVTLRLISAYKDLVSKETR
jgi:branched-chain amino acid aminotransferase